MDKLNSQNAETVIPKDVAAVKVETAAPLAETHEAHVAAVEHNKDAETVIQAGKKFETVISNVEADKVHAKEVETIKSAAPIESVAQEQGAVMNRYGDVLSRINAGHAQKLSTTKQLTGNQFAPSFGGQFASNFGSQQPSFASNYGGQHQQPSSFNSRFGSQHQQPSFTSNFGQFGQNKQFGQAQQLGPKSFGPTSTTYGNPSMQNIQQSGPSTYQPQQAQGQQRARILSGSSPVSRKTISQSMVSYGGQQRAFDFGRPQEATSVLNNRPGQQQYNGAGAPQFWSPQQNVRVMNTQGFRF